jgi:hypothetical protein
VYVIVLQKCDTVTKSGGRYSLVPSDHSGFVDTPVRFSTTLLAWDA